MINFILGSGFGAILIQRDFLVLHGNALERNKQAIICLGSSGSGKSTLAFSLMKKGWNLISDDLVAITSEGFILPGIPRIKLWKEVLDAFSLDSSNYKSIRKGINKFKLDNNEVNNVKEPSKLRSIHIINVNISEMNNNYFGKNLIKSQKNAVIKIRDNLFRPRFIKGLKKEGDNFIKIINLVKNIEIFDLILPNGIINMDKSLNKINL